MAITAAACLTPSGRLNGAALWPKGGKLNPLGYDEAVVNATLVGYIAEGYAKTALDAAVLQWVYYRAYQEAYERLLLMPASVTVSDQGGSSYMQAQIDAVGRLASDALAAFEALVPTAIPDEGYDVITSLR